MAPRETGVCLSPSLSGRWTQGPVLAQERVQLDEAVQAPELLAQLFQRGARMLLAAAAGGGAGHSSGEAAVPQVRRTQQPPPGQS